MMKNRFLAAVAAVFAGVSVTSCDNIQELIDQVIEVSISAENDAFDADGQAVVKLSLNAASNKDITVILGLSSEAEEGFTAVDSDALDFEGSVTIPAGTEFLPVTVKLKEDAEILENQEAIITIVSASGASVGKDSVVYIKIPAEIYNGGDKEDEKKVIVSIAAESDVFDDNGEAVVKVSLSEASDKEVSVTLGVGSEAREGYSAISALALAFEPSVTIAAGDLETSVKIAVVLDVVEEGQEAVIVIASASGAEVAEGAVAYIKVPESQQQNGDAFKLDWTVKYIGCEWVEGYYDYGQLEVFEVSNTDTQKFYKPIIVDLSDGEDYATMIAADPGAFFTALQSEIEEEIAEEMEDYDETREQAIPELYYNEVNDGSEILFYGLPAGKYQFVVVSLDANGILDKGYSVIEFTKTEDALEDYDWNLSLTVNPEWYAKFGGWVDGYESKYYYVEGYAPGAAYVMIESYTAEELDYYLDGDIKNFFNDAQTRVKDELYSGYEMSQIATVVDSDGSFLDFLSTYNITGETHIYIAAFDADGNILSTYGDSVIEIPEYVENPITWVEKKNWAVNYDASVNTGDEDYPYAVVATACDAPEYFIIEVYSSGTLDSFGIDAVGDDALYYVKNYGLSMCYQYGMAFNSVPAVYTVSKIKNGQEAFIFGVTADGKLTGEWYMEIIEGVETVPPAEWVERKDWAVNYDASVDTGDKDYPYAIVATVCDAPYFVTTVWDANGVENDGLEEISEDALYFITKYGMETCLEYDLVHTSVPAVEAWSGLENGMEVYIFAVDQDGKLTGEWYRETLTGIEGQAALSIRKKTALQKGSVKLEKESRNFDGRKIRSAIKVDASRKSFKAEAAGNAQSGLKKLIKK